MSKHKFSLTIEGTESEAEEKAKGLAIIASYLNAKTITALAKVVQTDPAKVELAKQFLGVK